MSMQQILGFMFLVVTAISLNMPNYLLRSSAKLSGRELGQRYPERAWVRFLYPLSFVLVIMGFTVLFFLGFGYFSIFTVSGHLELFALGGLMGFVPLLNGAFALLTGVAPVNQRRQYLYVYDDDLVNTVGLLSIAQGIVILLIAASAIYFWGILR